MLEFFGLAILAIEGIKSLFESTLPAGTHGNYKLESEDIEKVRNGEMTKSQFKKNMRNGKYYCVNEESVDEYNKMKKEFPKSTSLWK